VGSEKNCRTVGTLEKIIIIRHAVILFVTCCFCITRYLLIILENDGGSEVNGAHEKCSHDEGGGQVEDC